MNKDKIVLMSCCAPCSVAAIKRMKAEGRDFAVLFYNPNIFPREEYGRRLSEQSDLCRKLGVEYAVGDWNHDQWLAAVKGLENEPERGGRCFECFKFRAKFGIKWAAENGCGKVASVFGVSKYKDQGQVDRAIKGESDSKDIDYWTPEAPFEYKPEEGMYRQKYCGCEFSAREISAARAAMGTKK